MMFETLFDIKAAVYDMRDVLIEPRRTRMKRRKKMTLRNGARSSSGGRISTVGCWR